jgi:uncharacterized membrane protein
VTSGRRGGIALAVVGSAAFAIAAHLALVQAIPPAAGALLCLIPLTGFVLWGLKRVHHRMIVVALLLAIAAVLWRNWAALEHRFPDVFFVEHVVANLALASLFGRTLLRGREPLVTRFARLVHGVMPPDLARYTRRVTIAWTVFFLAIALASTVLYAAGWRSAWSLLVNFLNAALVGTMFVAEYAIRHRVLPDLERIGVLGGIRAFSRHVAARAETSR